MKLLGHFVRSSLCALAVSTLLSTASAQSGYPKNSISMVVGFSAGGPADVVARTLAPALNAALGVPLVIENKPGADGTIAATQVARAEPDGYTILLAPSTHAINASLYKKLPYDPINSFSPIALIGESPNIIAVHPSVPAKTVSELVAYAKRSDSGLNYASTSSVTELATELLNLSAGVKMVKIPYKGAGQAMPALLSGEVQLMVSSLMTLLPQVQAGRVRALAVTSRSRVDIAPNIPTVEESGLPGYEASTWYGLFAPANTPKEVIVRLSQATAQIMKDKDLQAKLGTQGLTTGMAVNSPEAFRNYFRAEAEKWRKVVSAAGLSAD